MEKRTLVMPYSPNIVTLFMHWLIATKEKVRDALGVGDAPSVKFIAAGPLRKEDWPGEAKLDAPTLESKGYLFIDCGGGELDRQALPENLGRGVTSSLHLLAERVGLDTIAPHLLPMVVIITAQDVRGERITVDHNHKTSATPHTARHLKNMILGWNLLCGPERVIQLAHTAFSGIESLIALEAEDLAALQPDKVVARIREMFLFHRLMEGINAHLANVHVFSSTSEQEAGTEAEQFRVTADQALQCWEGEWDEAVNDYWKNARLRTVIINERKGDEVRPRKATVVIGTSDSERFGQVARLGNEGHPEARPFKGKPFRYKADVIIQFHRNGRFHISTRGEIFLDDVAKLLRQADLTKKGVRITPELMAELSRPGNLAVKNERGSRVETIYFPEYRKGLGNAFRSNPQSPLCMVHSKEIEDLTCKGLSS